jgi:hypothetical protein
MRALEDNLHQSFMRYGTLALILTSALTLGLAACGGASSATTVIDKITEDTSSSSAQSGTSPAWV